jgi:putative membrane protein
MKLILRWLITAVSLYVAVLIVTIMALVLGFVNAIIRPLLKLMSCGVIVLTLGLFVFVINAATFMLASNIAQNWLNVGFYVESFGAALLGSIVVSVVSVVLSSILIDDKEK